MALFAQACNCYPKIGTVEEADKIVWVGSGEVMVGGGGGGGGWCVGRGALCSNTHI